VGNSAINIGAGTTPTVGHDGNFLLDGGR